jgi:hemerythrin superfamily protein
MSDTNIFDLVKADHQSIDHLFLEIESASDRERPALIDACMQEILVHLEAEEATLYARLRSADTVRQDVFESEEEHALIAQLAREVSFLMPGDERCDAKLAVLRELVERHVEQEEEEMIPIAEGIIDPEMAEALGEEMRQLKDALRQQQAPDGLAAAAR